MLLGSAIAPPGAAASIATSVSNPQPVSLVESLSLPPALGHLNTFWFPGNTPQSIVFILQDIHADPHAQQGISGLLELLRERFDVRLIAHEGASGRCRTDLYAALPDRESRDAVARVYLSESLFSGAEFYAVTHPDPVRIEGIEDAELYEQHLSAALSALEQQPEDLRNLSRLRDALNALDAEVFPESWRELLAAEQAFRAAEPESLDIYLDRLASLASSHRVDLNGFPLLAASVLALEIRPRLDRDAVAAERKALLQWLWPQLDAATRTRLNELAQASRGTSGERFTKEVLLAALNRGAALPLVWNGSGFAPREALQPALAAIEQSAYPNLVRYALYLESVKALNSPDWFQELDALRLALEITALREPRAQALAQAHRLLQARLDLTGLKALRATAEGQIDGSASTQSLRGLIGELLSEAAAHALTEERLAPYARYYELAFARDRSLSENLLRKIEDNPGVAMALVAGGFHTEGITARLRAQGIAYAVITPPAGEHSDQRYRERLRRALPSFAALAARQHPALKDPLITEEAPGNDGATWMGVAMPQQHAGLLHFIAQQIAYAAERSSELLDAYLRELSALIAEDPDLAAILKGVSRQPSAVVLQAAAGDMRLAWAPGTSGAAQAGTVTASMSAPAEEPAQTASAPKPDLAPNPPSAANADASEGTVTPEQAKDYISASARDIWDNYFLRHVSPRGLPYDNVQILETDKIPEPREWPFERLADGSVRAAPTSPTNIAFWLTAVASAHEMGWISREEAVSLLSTTLETLGAMELWHGLFYNFYDARDLVVTSRLVSTVDNGNLAAGLIATGNLFPELKGAADAILNEMDFSQLYDKEKGLLIVGYWPEEDSTFMHFGDLATEARIASLVAVALGRVPADIFDRLDRTPAPDYPEVPGSRYGGAMEYLKPSIFYEEPPMNLHVAVRAQKEGGVLVNGLKPWGRSESAIRLFDSRFGMWVHRYGPTGVPGLVARKYRNEPGEKIESAPEFKDARVTPHASFYTLGIPGTEPASVVENLRNFETLGLRDEKTRLFFDAAQVRDGTQQVYIATQFMTNHQGTSLAQAANYLRDGVLRHAFSGDARIQRVLPLAQGGNMAEAVPAEAEEPPSRELTLSEPAPQAHWFNGGTMTHLGSGVFTNPDGIAANVFKPDPIEQEPWGAFTYISEDGETWSAAYAPTGVADPEAYQAEFDTAGVTIRNRHNGVNSEERTWVLDGMQVREVTLTNDSDAPRTLAITHAEDIALQRLPVHWSHTLFHKLFVETKFLSPVQAVFAGRRGHSGKDMPYLVVFSDGRVDSFETSRLNFYGSGGPAAPAALRRDPMVGITRAALNRLAALERSASLQPWETKALRRISALIRSLDAGVLSRLQSLRHRGALSGMTGTVLEPMAALQRRVALKPGESQTVRFVTAFVSDEKTADDLASAMRQWSASQWESARKQAREKAILAKRAAGVSQKNAAALESLRSQLLYPLPRASGGESPRPVLAALARDGIAESSQPDPAGAPMGLFTVRTREDLDLATDLVRLQRQLRAEGRVADFVFVLDSNDAAFDQHARTVLQAAWQPAPEPWLRETLGGFWIVEGARLGEADRQALMQAPVVRVFNSADAAALALQIRQWNDAARERARDKAVRPDTLGSAHADAEPQTSDAENARVVLAALAGDGAAAFTPPAPISTPLTLLSVRDRDDLQLAMDLIKSQRQWRAEGTRAEFAFVLETDDPELRQLAAAALKAAWTRVRGDWLRDPLQGFWIIDGSRIGEDARETLERAATAVYPVPQITAPAPLSTAPPVRVENPEPEAVGDIFALDEQNNELVIRDPYAVEGHWTQGLSTRHALEREVNGRTVHAQGGPNFGIELTQRGFATLLRYDAQNFRTPFVPDPARDDRGGDLFLRDRASGRSISLTPGPSRRDPADRDVRFGDENYAIYETRGADLDVNASVRIHVPPEQPLAVIEVDVENLRDDARELDLTGMFEIALGKLPHTSSRQTLAWFDDSSQAVLARHPESEFAESVTFFAPVLGEASSHALDRAELVGLGRSLENPAAQETAELSNAASPLGNPMAGLRVPVTVAGKSTGKIVLVFGQAANADEARALIEEYREGGEARVASSLEETRRYWNETLTQQAVTASPYDFLNRMLRWLQRQAIVMRMTLRAGIHQFSGALGGRDQIQDHLIFAHTDPLRLREMILYSARNQFPEGDIPHWHFPYNRKGARTRFSDDLLWMAYAIPYYINATGDYSVLDEVEPFLRGQKLKRAEHDRVDAYEYAKDESATVYEHGVRSIERVLSLLGEHGLTLMGTGDWNDGMGEVGAGGKGESIWLAEFLYNVLKEYIPLAERQGDGELADKWRRDAAALEKALEEHGWDGPDGQWYRRAYFDSGNPLGSAGAEAWEIDSLTQSWAVISGAGDPKKARAAMEQVYRRLVDKVNRLVFLGWPLFHRIPEKDDPGHLAHNAPGTREHGVYHHAALWVAMAFAILGDGDRAWEILNLINPMELTRTLAGVKAYAGDPHAVAADRVAAGPYKGRAGWTQYTGSAGWFYRIVTEYVLGMRFRAGGLLVDPCLPTAWTGYEAVKRHRRPVRTADGWSYEETVYAITVEKPQGISKGRVTYYVDGELWTGETLPFEAGREYAVRVVITPFEDGTSGTPADAEAAADTAQPERLLPEELRRDVGESLAEAGLITHEQEPRLIESTVPWWVGLYPGLEEAYSSDPLGVEQKVRALAEEWVREDDTLSAEQQAFLFGDEETGGVLDRTLAYFRDFVGAETHWLPPDHILGKGVGTVNPKEGRELLNGRVAYLPTSPTDIGAYLEAIATAVRIGRMEREEGLMRLRNALNTLAELQDHPASWFGMLPNWINTKTLVVTDEFISTVDNGNLAAALRSVGNLIPEVRNQTRGIRRRMEFKRLYNTERQMFHNGFRPGVGLQGEYPMEVSEVAATYYEAIAEGEIAPQSLTALQRDLVDTHAGRTIKSHAGTMMEIGVPLLKISAADVAPHSRGVAFKRAAISQILLAERLGLPVYGRSESGWWVQEPDGTWVLRYRTQGDDETGPQHHVWDPIHPEEGYVMSPYAAALMLRAGIPRGSVAADLQRFAALGSMDPEYGLFEALQFMPGDGSRSAVEVPQLFMHHQSWIFQSLAALIAEEDVRNAYQNDPAVQARVIPALSDVETPAEEKADEAEEILAPSSQFLGYGNEYLGGRYTQDHGQNGMVLHGREFLEGFVIQAVPLVSVLDEEDRPIEWTRVPAAYQPGVGVLEARADGLAASSRTVVDARLPLAWTELTLTNTGDEPRRLRPENPFAVLDASEQPIAFSANGDGPFISYGRGPADGPAGFLFADTDGAVDLAPGQSITMTFGAGLTVHEAAGREIARRYRQADERKRAETLAETKARLAIFAQGLRKEEYKSWEMPLSGLALARLAPAPASFDVMAVVPNVIASNGRHPQWPSVVYWINNREKDLPSAQAAIRLERLWRSNGVSANVIFVLNLDSPEAEDFARFSLQSSWKLTYPGWDERGREGFYIVEAQSAGSAALTALHNGAAVVMNRPQDPEPLPRRDNPAVEALRSSLRNL